MIGNDIVDFKFASSLSGSRGSRWLTKVFTQHELDYITHDQLDAQMAWRLWSMKESAYKAHKQQNRQYLFNPIKIDCQISSSEEGEVIVGGSTYVTSTISSLEYVSTIASGKEAQKRLTRIIKIADQNPEQQSTNIRKAVISDVANYLNLPLGSIAIQKDALGIPEVHICDSLSIMALSLAHHGNYAGYAIHVTPQH
jgi:phosphopantetheinyl transferase (holo-ACP synthase)